MGITATPSNSSLTAILGADAAFPIVGDFKPIQGVNTLLQDMQILLLTIPGERVFRPTFGCNLRDQVWENLNEGATNGAIAIQAALGEFEPRITVLDVSATSVNENTGLIVYNINFIINNTDSVYNLVFPYRAGTQLSFS